MNYQLIGDVTHALLLNLQPGEGVVAEAGALLFCNDAISFETRSGGGALGGLQRAAAGEIMALTHFECIAPGGALTLAAPYPGKVQAMELAGNSWICTRDSFLGATTGVTLEVTFNRKFGSGPTSTEGFTLQRASGSGTLFLHLGGNLVESDLEAGQTLRVDPACIAAFELTVEYDIQFNGGFKNALFGGEGTHVVALRGPGKVFLQTLPFSRLAARITAAQNAGAQSTGSTATGAVIGGGQVYANE